MIKTDRFKAFILVGLLLSSFQYADAQSDSLVYEEVRSLTNFYEYLLNTVGSNNTSVRDKEVIMNESFKKVFMNDQVQIEDDLLPDRKVITNKNVTAYLRDVDFFFQDISFDFENLKISQDTRLDAGTYYQVSFESLLKGTTLEGTPFERRSPRFLEVNVDSIRKDLKIVSVYSTKITREKELQIWWENLSNTWKSLLIDYVPFDSISEDLPIRISKLDSLNLEGNFEVLSIAPLQALKELRYINLANTQVVDLTPLRYASQLKYLNLANTPIYNLRALQYFKSLEQLDIQNTLVTDLQPLSKLENLQVLNLRSIPANNFTPIMDLQSIRVLDASQTSFLSLTLLTSQKLQKLILHGTSLSNLSGAEKLPALIDLQLDQSEILSLDGIENHPKLTKISFASTSIGDLSPLSSIPNLREVAADNTPITEKMASQFMRSHPGVTMITNSAERKTWWDNLSDAWRKALQPIAGTNPGENELARLFQIDSLSLTRINLKDPTPLVKFEHLVYLDIRNTELDPSKELAQLTALETLLAANSRLTDLSFCRSTPNLTHLDASNSAVASIQGLQGLQFIEKVDLSASPVSLENPESIKETIGSGSPAVIVFRTETLQNWRDSLSQSWSEALQASTMDAFELHALTQQSQLKINDAPISDFSGLVQFFNLTSIQLDQTSISSIMGVEKLTQLKDLAITNSPLRDISGLKKLMLEKVNFSNTAIEDLDAFEQMKSLTHLNISGTQVRRVKALESLTEMQVLDISNTQVFRLDKLSEMKRLKKLICYNTKLRAHEIEDFRQLFPNCEVIYY